MKRGSRFSFMHAVADVVATAGPDPKADDGVLEILSIRYAAVELRAADDAAEVLWSSGPLPGVVDEADTATLTCPVLDQHGVRVAQVFAVADWPASLDELAILGFACEQAGTRLARLVAGCARRDRALAPVAVSAAA